jgi:catalase
MPQAARYSIDPHEHRSWLTLLSSYNSFRLRQSIVSSLSDHRLLETHILHEYLHRLLSQADKDLANGQIETTGDGNPANTSHSLRAGPRGYNLLEDTTVRKKMLHFDRERTPERVVHALGHGAYGQFESFGDWSNITSACWLRSGAVSEVFTRFSVVVASNGGSESGRDTHGFATKIYSECGNQDLVGNHVSSFFINDGA